MAIPQQAAVNRQPAKVITDLATIDQLYFGHTVVATAATGKALTIPADLFLGVEDECVGMSFDVIQGGAGAFTVTAGGGVTVNAQGGLKATNGQFALITVTCLGPNSYNVSGNRA